MKELHEMTAAELGRLFPIVLKEYDPRYETFFEQEKGRVLDALGGCVSLIEHIGSTAVNGMISKPTIDILAEIGTDAGIDVLTSALCGLGYAVNQRNDRPPPHLTFVKGYSPNGLVGMPYHLHIRYPGKHDEIVLRDYLRTNAQARKDYAELKERLAKEYEFDRELYTAAKTHFILDAIEKAEGCPRPPL